VHRGYVDALNAIGACPVLVPASEGVDVERCVDVVARFDAVLATGGGDVDPPLYGAAPSDLAEGVDRHRDEIETVVVVAARARGVPVLGICRGIQLVTVALGGTLVVDLPTVGCAGHWEEERQNEPVHPVSADPGTLAAAALAGARTVNSIHHQAVADPGLELVASAWCADGVIEAVEADGVLGVQWHPERLLDHDRRHLAPFEWLVTT
jgi:putative glutamine amidotransferase